MRLLLNINTYDNQLVGIKDRSRGNTQFPKTHYNSCEGANNTAPCTMLWRECGLVNKQTAAAIVR